MSLSSKTKESFISPLNKGFFAIALFAAFTANAIAQVCPPIIHDPAHTASNVGLSGTEVGKMLANLKMMKDQYENLQKNLVSLDGLKPEGLSMDDAFKERPNDFGLKARCPGAGLSLNPKELLTAFVINPKSNIKEIKEEQHKICQRLVYAENAKYNETVKMLNLVRKEEQRLKGVGDRRGQVGDKPGKLQANSNELLTQYAGAKRNIQYHESVIEIYDEYIETLKTNQKFLTDLAMKGNASDDGLISVATRKVVQGATLKVALGTISDRDR